MFHVDTAQHAGDSQTYVSALGYAFLFIWYFVSWSIVLFFNVAIIHCAKLRFDGQTPTVSDGFQCAVSHLPRILAWAAVSATVGVVLQAIADRNKIVGGIIKWIVGAAWAVATFFIVPVMIYEKLSLYDSFKRSIQLVGKSWGEAAVGTAGVSTIIMLLALPSLALPVVGGVALQNVGFVGGLGLMFAWWVLLAVLGSALTGIMRAALYNYASTGLVPANMSRDVFENAFKAKR